MPKRIALCLLCSLSLFSCVRILSGYKIEKIIVEKREHEYLGKAVETREITGARDIEKITGLINHAESDILKFAGKYRLRFFSGGKEILVLRTDESGTAFEIIRSERNPGFRYFKTPEKINFGELF